MRTINFVIALFLLLCVTACSKQEIIEEDQIEKVPPRTLRLKASMPDEETKSGTASTRLSFTETEEGTITVQWKAGDKINLCFVSEDGTIVRTISDVAMTNISENGKQADFDITIPEEISGTFHLYGVYGAPFTEENSSNVVLPAPAASSSGIALGDAEDISVMRFAAKNLTEASSPQVSFSHIGSIFSVWIYNDTASPLNVSQIRVSSASHKFQWLKNSSGQALFNLADNQFTAPNAGSDLLFSSSGLSIAPYTTSRLYRWVIPGDAIDSSDTSKKIDFSCYTGSYFVNTVSARTLLAGKYYRLKMVWDGSIFSNIKTPTKNNLVAYWPFDGNAEDAEGTNHGTLYGNVTLTTGRKGDVGGAYHFDGSKGDYIRCVAPGITGSTARTISLWAKADALSTNVQALFAYGENDGSFAYGRRFEISLTTGNLVFDRGGTQVGKPSSLVSNNRWNHYAIVYKGREAGETVDTLDFYVNGTYLSPLYTNSTNMVNTTTQYPIYFGSLYDKQRYFKGAIDEVRMYDRALIESEVKGLYYKDWSN